MEVCLHLAVTPGVEVVPICRSELASVLLRRAGIKCRHGSISDPHAARALLTGCDLVADFSLPKGLATEIREAITTSVKNAVHEARSHTRYVYISSIMAYGMPYEWTARLKHYILPRTVYGAAKRFGERIARNETARVGRELWILRLGCVHGELQSITRSLLATIDERPAVVPPGESTTVFVSTIAEALVSIARGEQMPGLYTLIADPPYSCAEIYAHYASRCGIAPRFIEERSKDCVDLRTLLSVFKRAFIRVLLSYREVIIAHILSRLPRLELYAKAMHLKRIAGAEIEVLSTPDVQRPFLSYRGERVPGRRLVGLSDPRKSISTREQAVQRLLEQIHPLACLNPSDFLDTKGSSKNNL